MPDFAGIGSRETPREVIDLIKNKLCPILAATGYNVWTGGAIGADSAFFDGYSDKSKVKLFLPEPGHNRLFGHYPTEEAFIIAEQAHPNWKACRQYARKLHARNSHIILGESLSDPVDFVICWTRNGECTGGTAQGIRLAKAYLIPIFNLGYNIKNTLTELKYFLDNGSPKHEYLF